MQNESGVFVSFLQKQESFALTKYGRGEQQRFDFPDQSVYNRTYNMDNDGPAKRESHGLRIGI